MGFFAEFSAQRQRARYGEDSPSSQRIDGKTGGHFTPEGLKGPTEDARVSVGW